MSKRTENKAAFWRWFWTESGEGRTGGHLTFLVVLGLAMFAASIPLWYWLVAEFGGSIGDHPPDPIIGISIATPGPLVVVFTVGACRPDGLPSYLLTGFVALLAGFTGQAGVAAAAAISVSQGFGVAGTYGLAILLCLAFALPAIGMLLTASYFLGWRRVTAVK